MHSNDASDRLLRTRPLVLRIRSAVIALAWLASSVADASSQQMLWLADSDRAGDEFGATDVGPDLDGDGIPELLVTNSWETCTHVLGGAVHVYSISGGELATFCGDGRWGEQAMWVDDVDGLGMPDLVVSQPRWFDPSFGMGPDTGRVQLLSYERGTVIHEWTGTAMSDSFGKIDVLDDLDGDGFRDLLVASEWFGSYSEGKIWVISTATGAEIRSHDGFKGSHLGMAFSALPDVDGDGFGDYVASWWVPIKSVQRCRIYSGASGSTVATLEAALPELLGASFGACPDVDGDGLPEVVIGGEQSFVEAYSAVTKKLAWRIDGVSGSGFGWAVLGVPDVDGDGHEELLVTSNVGKRVDLISGRTHRSLYRFDPPVEGVASYGEYLAPSADFDGDGFPDLVIGTPANGTNQSHGGHVAIYAGNDLWLQATPAKPQVGDTVVVDLRGGAPGRLGMVVLTEISGVPTFDVLLVTPFDVNGELQLTADVDPSVSGLSFTLMAWAQNRTGRGPLMDATPAVVDAQ